MHCVCLFYYSCSPCSHVLLCPDITTSAWHTNSLHRHAYKHTELTVREKCKWTCKTCTNVDYCIFIYKYTGSCPILSCTETYIHKCTHSHADPYTWILYSFSLCACFYALFSSCTVIRKNVHMHTRDNQCPPSCSHAITHNGISCFQSVYAVLESSSKAKVEKKREHKTNGW